MKIKKSSPAEGGAPAAGGAVIADRFKLDVEPEVKTTAGVNKTATSIAMFAALVSLGLMGTVAALMYFNWEFIKDI